VLDAEIVLPGATADEPAVDEQRELLEAPKKPLGIFFWCCVGWLVLLALATIFASFLHLDPPNFPYNNAPFYTNAPPSLAHWLGTDENGRDVLSRLVYGGRVSLVIGLGGTAIGIFTGGILGMLSAYVRGRLDAVMSFVAYVFLAFPAIIAVLCLLFFWGRSEFHIVVILGAFSVPFIFRVVRAATLGCATKEYVTAAKSQGATARRVIAKEIFPNIIPSLIAYTVFTFGGIITTEGALGFLGLSVPSPEASWGNMIGGASSNPTATLAYVFAPAIALFLTLLALNFAGERIRLRFDTNELKL
jgi:peptide/nickel transport system permease protein